MLGDYVFSSCSGLTSITIPDSVTSIGDYAFSGCSGLTSITIPDSVTSIGNGAFSGCGGLTSITIPNSVTSIGYGAFSHCTGLKVLTVADKNPVYHSVDNCIIHTSDKRLVAGCKSSVIPADGSVTSIGYGAFWGCSGLTGITIPDSVISIGGRTFSDCSSLMSVTIPDTVMHTFFPEQYPIAQPCDYDGDGVVTEADAIYLLMYTFFPDQYPISGGR